MNVLKWNKIDQCLYALEQIAAKWKESHGQLHEDPIDAETMIEAETAYLRSENEKLKKLQQPGHIICDNNKYYCPHCGMEISSLLLDEFKIKYCPECGKRVVLSIPYHYAVKKSQVS